MSDLFNDKAKDWDTSERKLLMSSAVGTSIIKYIRLNQQMDVMDFGAGTGLVTAHIAPFINKVLAVDISQAMLDKLTSKTELHNKVEALCQDIVCDPIDTKFDLIVSAMALHHVKDTTSLLNTFSKNLKSGAKIALADLDKEDGDFHPAESEGVYHSGFERGNLQSILENTGFHDIQFFTIHTINKSGKQYPMFLVVATKQ